MQLVRHEESLHLFDVRQPLTLSPTLTLTWSLVAVVVNVLGLICWPFPASGLAQRGFT